MIWRGGFNSVRVPDGTRASSAARPAFRFADVFVLSLVVSLWIWACVLAGA